MATKSRLLSRLIEGDGSIKTTQIDSDAIGTSAAKSITAASGTTIYSSADTLPVSAAAGDQAFVSSTNRLYISNGSGWYNIALINNTPYWITEADGSYTLSTTGDVTTITILAQDSDGINVVYTAVTDSDFDNIATVTKDSDNGRTFTITPTDSENGTAVAGTGTVTFKATDGVNLVSTLSTFSLTFITIVANSAETTILLKADTAETDNQADASTNNHTITEGGNITSTAFTPYHPGGYSFDKTGSTSWLQLTTSGDLQAIGRSGTALTIEAWVYLKAAPNAYGTGVYSQGVQGSTNTGTNTISFEIQQDRTLRSLVNGQYNSITNCPFSTGTVPLKEWTHIALVLHNNTWTHYINGVADGTATGSYPSGTVANTAYIGRIFYDSQRYADMKISDLRITSTALYTSTFTPPTERLASTNDTLLLTCHLPYFTDSSSNNYTISVVGSSAVSERFGPYDYDPYTKTEFGGSVYFDGSGDYLVPDITTAVGTSDFTLEGWFYPTSTAVDTTIFDFRSSGNWGIFSILANNTVAYYNGSSSVGTTSNTVTDNTWNHIAIVRNSGSIKIYINGVLGSTTADTTNWTLAASPRIGGNKGNVAWMNGYIADVRFVSGTAVYTSDFTPPTAPLTAIANTQLLTCTNKNDIWEQGSGSLLTKVGNTTASNTQRKFTESSAIYLDGSGDYITYPGSDFDVFPEDFTIEWWQYWASNVSGYGTIYDNNYTTSPNLLIQTNDPGNVNQYKVFMAGFSTTLIESSAASTGQWYHYALVRNGSTITMYRNGTSTGSVTLSGSIGSSAGTKGIGAASNGNYPISESYIQDFRITKGLARYTSNFTPPTAEFDG